eukprot:jgi/Psemu1/24933/gm1.24933_g
MKRGVSCLDIHPFLPRDSSNESGAMMDVSAGGNDDDNDNDAKAGGGSGRIAHIAALCAVGLWDDFTVRLLSLESESLAEVLQIHLSTEDEAGDSMDDDAQGKRRNRNNMMARSLCLITMDFSSSGGGSASASSSHSGSASSSQGSSPGVNMLLVGLGDGTLVSFAVIQDGRSARVKSKKEVSLGTQRIHLVPLQNQRGGNCVLATGDRPTVIYLAGMGGGSERANYNPKLCYSNVNLSPVDEGEPSDANRPQ